MIFIKILSYKKRFKSYLKPEDYLFNSKIKDISDNFRIEVNYKSKASKLFEVDLSFNQKDKCLFKKKNKTYRNQYRIKEIKT